MTIPQLDPLLVLAATLERSPETADVASEIKRVVSQAASPSMAQNACEHIIVMCNPKGWGDRYVSGMSHAEWLQYLGRLSDTAAQCGQAIFDAAQRN
jgi:hypothetical protein